MFNLGSVPFGYQPLLTLSVMNQRILQAIAALTIRQLVVVDHSSEIYLLLLVFGARAESRKRRAYADNRTCDSLAKRSGPARGRRSRGRSLPSPIEIVYGYDSVFGVKPAAKETPSV